MTTKKIFPYSSQAQERLSVDRQSLLSLFLFHLNAALILSFANVKAQTIFLSSPVVEKQKFFPTAVLHKGMHLDNTCASYDLYDFGCNPASLFRNIPLFPLSNCFDYGCKGNILYRYRLFKFNQTILLHYIRIFQYLSMQQIQEHEPGINRRSFREMLFCSF